MLTHHVFFWLRNKGNEQEAAALMAGLQTLTTIESKVSIHIGVPANIYRPVVDATYDFSLLIIFNNMEEHDAYQVHPLHKEFTKSYAYLWQKVVIYDSVDPA